MANLLSLYACPARSRAAGTAPFAEDAELVKLEGHRRKESSHCRGLEHRSRHISDSGSLKKKKKLHFSFYSIDLALLHDFAQLAAPRRGPARRIDGTSSPPLRQAFNAQTAAVSFFSHYSSRSWRIGEKEKGETLSKNERKPPKSKNAI